MPCVHHTGSTMPVYGDYSSNTAREQHRPEISRAGATLAITWRLRPSLIRIQRWWSRRLPGVAAGPGGGWPAPTGRAWSCRAGSGAVVPNRLDKEPAGVGVAAELLQSPISTARTLSAWRHPSGDRTDAPSGMNWLSAAVRMRQRLPRLDRLTRHAIDHRRRHRSGVHIRSTLVRSISTGPPTMSDSPSRQHLLLPTNLVSEGLSRNSRHDAGLTSYRLA